MNEEEFIAYNRGEGEAVEKIVKLILELDVRTKSETSTKLKIIDKIREEFGHYI